MAKKSQQEHTLNAVEIVQKITQNEYWGWTQPPAVPPETSEEAARMEREREEACAALEAARGGDISPLLGLICKRLEACEIVEAHGIIHNKDKKLKWDELQQKEIPFYVDLHVQILLKFRKAGKYNPARTLSNLSATLGLAPERLYKLKKGRYSYDDKLAYLIHMKDEDKYQYSASEVVSFIVPGEGKSYSEYYAERRVEWLKGRAKKVKKKAAFAIDDILQKIRYGEITKKQMLLTPELYKIYGLHKRQCNDAFHTYSELAAARTERAIENHELRISTFFFFGVAEGGKSRLARECIKAIIKRNGAGKWRFLKTPARNAMDKFAGEEIVWMDDARGETMNVSDWLTFLDSYEISPMSVRYQIVTPSCRVIIITSTKSPLEFFYHSSEDMDQFLRRIAAVFHIHDNGHSTEYVNSIVNIYRTIRCEKHLVHVSEDLDSPIAQVSRELKSDGVNYDVGQAADVICNLVAEAHNKERLVAEAGPPIELIRSSDEDWYLHLEEPKKEELQADEQGVQGVLFP